MGWLRNILRHSVWILIIIGAVALVSLVRCFAFTSCTIPTDGMAPALCSGDRIIVNLWSYGLRRPFAGRLGYGRTAPKWPRHGDVVVFNNPMSGIGEIDRRELFISRCIACPGDSVIVDSMYSPVSYRRWKVNREGLRYLVVPGRRVKVEVTPWNRTLLMNMMNMHEGRRAEIRDERLFVDGVPTRVCSFSKDYFWMMSDDMRNTGDSRLFGFVPDDHVVGRAVMVWFSKDPQMGPLSGYRYGRFFKGL